MELWNLIDRLNILGKVLSKEKDFVKSKKLQEEYFETVKELDRKRLEEFYKNKENEKNK